MARAIVDMTEEEYEMLICLSKATGRTISSVFVGGLYEFYNHLDAEEQYRYDCAAGLIPNQKEE